MAKAPDKGRTREKARTPRRPAALAKPADRTPTKKELADALREIVNAVNLSVAKAGLEDEQIANLLFSRVFGNMSTKALSPDARSNRLYRELRARAGHSLELDPDDLREFLIIGALNQRLLGTGWPGLKWSVKRVLLSLLDPKDSNLVELRRGVEFASRTGSSLLDVQRWKQAEYPQLPGTRGRPRGLTVAAGRRFVETGVRLGNERERQQFATRVKEAPAPAYRAFVKDLEKTIENLTRLRAELAK